MKKTFCDRCGAPANNKEIQRFIMFDVNKAMDLCDDCYSQLCRWLRGELNENCKDCRDGKDCQDDGGDLNEN